MSLVFRLASENVRRCAICDGNLSKEEHTLVFMLEKDEYPLARKIQNTAVDVITTSNKMVEWSEAVCVGTHVGDCGVRLKALVLDAQRNIGLKKNDRDAMKIMKWQMADAKTIEIFRNLLIDYSLNNFNITEAVLHPGAAADFNMAASYSLTILKKDVDTFPSLPFNELTNHSTRNSWPLFLQSSFYVIFPFTVQISYTERQKSFSCSASTILQYVKSVYASVFTDKNIDYFITGDIPELGNSEDETISFKMYFVLLKKGAVNAARQSLGEIYNLTEKEKDAQCHDLLQQQILLWNAPQFAESFDKGAWSIVLSACNDEIPCIESFVNYENKGDLITFNFNANTHNKSVRQAAIFVQRGLISSHYRSSAISTDFVSKQQEGNELDLAVAIVDGNDQLISFVGSSKSALVTVLEWNEKKGKKASFMSCTIVVR